MPKTINLKPGVISGHQWLDLNQSLKKRRAALPAVCISSPSTANAALAAAREVNSPLILLTSFGGAHFAAGKSLPATPKTWTAGAISLANHVHQTAELYGVPVALGTDHCQPEKLEWLNLMLDADQAHLNNTGGTLWSGHMADLSELPLNESLPIYVELLKRHHKLGIVMEYELGQTGGEEDGIEGPSDNLYTTPEEALQAHQTLSKISPLIAAALSFGNVHGVYQGEFDLRPDILRDAQALVQKVMGSTSSTPMDLVFHGGSGCTPEQITQALLYGVVKQNVDTDLQFAYSQGLVKYVTNNSAYLQTQVGNPEGPEKLNKKKYDPRAILPSAEATMQARVVESYKLLNATGLLD